MVPLWWQLFPTHPDPGCLLKTSLTCCFKVITKWEAGKCLNSIWFGLSWFFSLYILPLSSDRSMEHTLCIEYLLYVICLLEARRGRCWCSLGTRVLFCWLCFSSVLGPALR